jgi:hypothetical protein
MSCEVRVCFDRVRQLSDQSARAEYDNRVQAAQQAAKELASELETVKAELSLAQVRCIGVLVGFLYQVLFSVPCLRRNARSMKT